MFYFSVPPRIDRIDLNVYPSVTVNRTVMINCPVTGTPTPDIVWMRNEEVLDPLQHPTFQFLAGGRQLRITNAQVGDSAMYRCFVSNKAGEDQVDFDLNVYGKTMESCNF